MKAYVKPNFEVTEFSVQETIAVCSPTQTYNPVTVSCVITGTHDIFYANCESNYNNLTIVSYGGKEYLVWRTGGGKSVTTYKDEEENPGMTLLNNILEAGGITWEEGYTYHAGVINPDIENTVNHSL